MSRTLPDGDHHCNVTMSRTPIHPSPSVLIPALRTVGNIVIGDDARLRYGGDDASRIKYIVGKWLQFQILDGKSIMNQVHEYENLVADVLSEDMKMCEILQTNVLLKKFPPSWNDYRNHLKHNKRDLMLQELISHMRTEGANRLKDKEISNSYFSIKANLDRFQHKGKKFKKNVQQKS
ncbi:hypothetical protein Sango_2116000 [Sesamum angolense]|uniref:Uncharacterized protein n=1 Tax=Sesamum angolense TaxID=2727404 RepID=A0AAE2BM82_9LAMI|nr:hypothetical protein Sango_2116000 [Sesamum angolense]